MWTANLETKADLTCAMAIFIKVYNVGLDV